MLKKLLKIIVFILILSTAGYVLYRKVYGKESSQQTKEVQDASKPLDLLFTVKRGDLSIGITQSGDISAKDNHKLSLEAAFNTKLMWIIDENKKVKTGDILAKFEKVDLIDRIDDLKIELDNVEKEIEISKEELLIQKSSNRADIRAAQDRVSNAEDALRKYHKFEKHKQKDNLNIKVEQAQKSFNEAQDAYKEKKNSMATTSFKNKDEEAKGKQVLKDLKQKMETESKNLRNAEMELKVFKRYDDPSKITQLDNNLAQAKLDLEKTKIKTASQIVQKEKQITNLKNRLRKIKKNLDNHESYLPMMQLVSPADGVVVYGDPDRRWGNPEIKVGMDIRRKQVLLTIPDMSELVINFELPEQFRSKVKIGDKAIITPDSVKGFSSTGKLSEIASLPTHQFFWDTNSPKIYKSTIELDKQNPKLVAGMTTQIEITTATLKNVLFVPIESVFEKDGAYFVYLRKITGGYKKASVEVGMSNDNFAQIKKGLEAGDQIYLYEPFSKKTSN